MGAQRSFPAYDDMQGILGTALVGVTTFTPRQLRNTGIVLPHITEGDVFSMVYQFSHRKKLYTNVASVHIHLIPIVSKNGNIAFTYAWGFYSEDETIPNTLPNTGTTADIQLVEADQYKSKRRNIVINLAHPSSEGYSDILYIKAVAAAPAAGTNWWATGNELAIAYMDAHFLTDRNGSLTENTD